MSVVFKKAFVCKLIHGSVSVVFKKAFVCKLIHGSLCQWCSRKPLMFTLDCVLPVFRDNFTGDVALTVSALAVSTVIAIIINDTLSTYVQINNHKIGIVGVGISCWNMFGFNAIIVKRCLLYSYNLLQLTPLTTLI